MSNREIVGGSTIFTNSHRLFHLHSEKGLGGEPKLLKVDPKWLADRFMLMHARFQAGPADQELNPIFIVTIKLRWREGLLITRAFQGLWGDFRVAYRTFT